MIPFLDEVLEKFKVKVIPLKKKQILEYSITWHGDTIRYGVSYPV